MTGAHIFPGVCSLATRRYQRRQCKQAQGCTKDHSNANATTGISEKSGGRSLLTLLSIAAVSSSYTLPVGVTSIVAVPELLHIVTGLDEGDADSWSQFLLDSGAAAHVSSNRARFKTLHYASNLGKVVVASGEKLNIVAYGDIDIEVDGQIVTLRNVLYVPDIKMNVISVKRLLWSQQAKSCLLQV